MLATNQAIVLVGFDIRQHNREYHSIDSLKNITTVSIFIFYSDVCHKLYSSFWVRLFSNALEHPIRRRGIQMASF